VNSRTSAVLVDWKLPEMCRGPKGEETLTAESDSRSIGNCPAGIGATGRGGPTSGYRSARNQQPTRSSDESPIRMGKVLVRPEELPPSRSISPFTLMCTWAAPSLRRPGARGHRGLLRPHVTQARKLLQQATAAAARDGAKDRVAYYDASAAWREAELEDKQMARQLATAALSASDGLDVKELAALAFARIGDNGAARK